MYVTNSIVTVKKKIRLRITILTIECCLNHPKENQSLNSTVIYFLMLLEICTHLTHIPDILHHPHPDPSDHSLSFHHHSPYLNISPKQFQKTSPLGVKDSEHDRRVNDDSVTARYSTSITISFRITSHPPIGVASVMFASLNG